MLPSPVQSPAGMVMGDSPHLDMVPWAVSYTHLDVYKRQVVNMAIIIINAFTNLKRVKKAVSRMMNISVAGYMACLLYTSRCV